MRTATACSRPEPACTTPCPTLLARAGALAAFYTDLHASHRPLQLLNQLWPRGLQPSALQRLLARQLPADLPRRLVRDQPLATLSWARRGFAGKHS